jgi:hypothetical protein
MDKFSLFNTRTCILGKSKSGKSCLLNYFLKSEKKKFDKIFVISGTEDVNGFYSKIIPKENIFDEYKEEWMVALIKKLNDYKIKNNKLYNVLLILDDLGGSRNFAKSEALEKCACQGRHFGLSFVVLLQYISQIPPVIRNNINYLIVGQCNQHTSQVLVDEFRFGDIDRKAFLDMYNKATTDYGFLMITCDSVKDPSNMNSLYGIVKCPEKFIT